MSDFSRDTRYDPETGLDGYGLADITPEQHRLVGSEFQRMLTERTIARIQHLIDASELHESPHTLDFYECEETISVTSTSAEGDEKVIGLPWEEGLELNCLEFLTALNELFPNVERLGFGSRHHSDGPWEYHFPEGSFPRLTYLYVGYIHDELISWIRRHPTLNTIHFERFDTYNATEPLPNNITRIRFELIQWEEERENAETAADQLGLIVGDVKREAITAYDLDMFDNESDDYTTKLAECIVEDPPEIDASYWMH